MWSWGSAATAGFLKIYAAYRIHPRILKELDEFITKPLLMIEWPWKFREVPADWKLMTLSQFSEEARRTTLVTRGLSVSVQCLVNLCIRLFWDVLRNT